jgi:hypothetical protein
MTNVDTVPPTSFLLLPGGAVTMRPAHHRRVGAYQLLWPAGDPRAPANGYLNEAVTSALQRLRATSINTRVPVVVAGHARDLWLNDILANAGTDTWVIPVVAGTAQTVSANARSDRTEPVHVLFLDERQVPHFRELGHLAFIDLDPDVTVTLDSGHRLQRCWAIVPAQLTPGDRPAEPEDERPSAGTDLSLLDGQLLEPDSEAMEYGRLVTTHPSSDQLFLVRPNLRTASRPARPPGDFAVAVSDDDGKALRLGRYAAISHLSDGHQYTVLAAVLRDDNTTTMVAQVDETLRDAVGAYVGDYVSLAPAKQPWRWRAVIDVFMPRRYLVMRTQVSDFTAFETATCSMPAYAMEILGVGQGDRVVLESAAPDGTVRELSLRAFATPEIREAQYREYLEPRLDARFPDASAILGVVPDLPAIFTDSEARHALVVPLCGPVRVRGSRRDQWAKELREVSLVLLVAIIGAVSLLDPGKISMGGMTIPGVPLILLAGAGTTIVLLYLGIRRRMR